MDKLDAKLYMGLLQLTKQADPNMQTTYTNTYCCVAESEEHARKLMSEVYPYHDILDVVDISHVAVEYVKFVEGLKKIEELLGNDNQSEE